jgi:hypothetical protein
MGKQIAVGQLIKKANNYEDIQGNDHVYRHHVQD